MTGIGVRARRVWLIVPLVTIAGMAAVLIGWHFPYATDDPVRREDAIRAFYDLSYSGTSTLVKDNPLTRESAAARTTFDVRGQVQRFVEQLGLEDAAVLDVGSGKGHLQDVVENYTGLDISSEAAKYYHKRFVPGTATAMPFADNEFDAAWSIWVLEHIPNPEAALSEIRRVVKSGGVLFLLPAWDCKPWAAQGYEARPYSDFGVGGKLIKASIPLRKHELFSFVTTVPNRMLRAAFAGSGPTRFHYRRLEPNFTEYWQADSDAVNDLDAVEMAMWFESRGDTCLNCLSGWWRYVQRDGGLVIRVNKAR
ncbi:MAG TPA: class I SAM-dependent methyltransferase [Gemmatimonadales bacterium]|nr:class I SAM-dependent methyltransferase [Gemmatimonadales bacterium]